MFKPSQSEIRNQMMRIEYNAATDEYSRGDGREVMKGWKSAVYSENNVFRKVENDWRMVYLARYPTIPS